LGTTAADTGERNRIAAGTAVDTMAEAGDD